MGAPSSRSSTGGSGAAAGGWTCVPWLGQSVWCSAGVLLFVCSAAAGLTQESEHGSAGAGGCRLGIRSTTASSGQRRRRQHTLSAYDEQDAILSDIDNLICHSPHVTLASAIGLQDRREASPTTADDTTAVDNEECYLLDGDDGQLFYMCTSPPSDNGNLQCEETADGLDWVCIANHGGYAA